jgi:hypothetical protein
MVKVLINQSYFLFGVVLMMRVMRGGDFCQGFFVKDFLKGIFATNSTDLHR